MPTHHTNIPPSSGKHLLRWFHSSFSLRDYSLLLSSLFSLLPGLSTTQPRHRAVQHQKPCSRNLCPPSASIFLACGSIGYMVSVLTDVSILSLCLSLSFSLISPTHRCAALARYTLPHGLRVPVDNGVLHESVGRYNLHCGDGGLLPRRLVLPRSICMNTVGVHLCNSSGHRLTSKGHHALPLE